MSQKQENPALSFEALCLTAGLDQMRKEARTLHSKAVNSLVIAVDHFNRCWDRGRVEAVLIMLDHAFVELSRITMRQFIVHPAEAQMAIRPAERNASEKRMTGYFGSSCSLRMFFEEDRASLIFFRVASIKMASRCRSDSSVNGTVNSGYRLFKLRRQA